MRTCSKVSCERPARFSTGPGWARTYCAECYAQRAGRRAATAAMQRCRCGEIAPLGGVLCRACVELERGEYEEHYGKEPGAYLHRHPDDPEVYESNAYQLLWRGWLARAESEVKS